MVGCGTELAAANFHSPTDDTAKPAFGIRLNGFPTTDTTITLNLSNESARYCSPRSTRRIRDCASQISEARLMRVLFVRPESTFYMIGNYLVPCGEFRLGYAP